MWLTINYKLCRLTKKQFIQRENNRLELIQKPWGGNKFKAF